MYFENSIAIYVAIYPLEGGVDCLVDPYIDNHIHIPRYLVDSVKIYEKTRLRRKKRNSPFSTRHRIEQRFILYQQENLSIKKQAPT